MSNTGYDLFLPTGLLVTINADITEILLKVALNTITSKELYVLGDNGHDIGLLACDPL